MACLCRYCDPSMIFEVAANLCEGKEIGDINGPTLAYVRKRKKTPWQRASSQEKRCSGDSMDLDQIFISFIC